MGVGHLDLTDWTWEPTVILGLVALCAAYVMAWRRGLLSDGDDVHAWFRSAGSRRWYFAAGVAVAFVALLSPIDTGGDTYLFSLHMVQHLLLMMVAPPLCLLGIAGMRRPDVASLGIRRCLAFLARPAPATVAFSAVLLVWHIPALYDATLTTEPIHVVEHLSFIAVGVLFWWPIVDPLRGDDTKAWVGAFPKIAMLVASGVPPTALGLIFTIAPHAFYDFYVRAPRLWGLTPVVDQQIAGVVMFGAGNIIYFIAAVVVFWRVFTDPAHDEAEALRTWAAADVPLRSSPTIEGTIQGSRRAVETAPAAAVPGRELPR